MLPRLFYLQHARGLHGFHRLPTPILAFFAAAIVFETVTFARSGKPYAWRSAAASIVVAALHRFAGVAHLLIVVPVYALFWSHRFFTLDLPAPIQLGIAFLAVEFAYYWMHRASHRIAFMWTNHSVHHSAEDLNFAAAVRLGATGVLSGEWVPFLPLILLGIDPHVVTQLLGVNLAYQFFLHTDTIPRLGPFEWVLNTPSHHRVHHAKNPSYLDKNFGGVVIIFDRLFGTYKRENPADPPRYGLLGEKRGDNPWQILFGGWKWLFDRVRSRQGWRGRIGALVRMRGYQR